MEGAWVEEGKTDPDAYLDEYIHRLVLKIRVTLPFSLVETEAKRLIRIYRGCCQKRTLPIVNLLSITLPLSWRSPESAIGR